MKFQIPSDFGDQIRKEFEKQIEDELRKAGVRGATVKIERDGKFIVDYPDQADERKLKQALEKMQRRSL